MRESLYYVVDARADIEIILQFAANEWAQKDIFRFLNQQQERFKACCGFHEQHIPEIRWIKQSDLADDISMDLTQGFNFEKLRPIKQKVRDSTALDGSRAEVERQDSSNYSFD